VLGNTSYVGTIGAIIMAGFVAAHVAMWWRRRGFGTPKVGPSAATGGPFFRPNRLAEFALLRFINRAGLGGSAGLDRLRGGGHAFPLGGGSDREPARNCTGGKTLPKANSVDPR
jgi:hypothetical protein